MDYKVGRYYTVPVAELEHNGKFHYIPVIDFPHKDKRFDVTQMHYHIDGRFSISKKLERQFNISNGHTFTIIDCERWQPFQFKKIVHKRKKCIRGNTGLGLPSSVPLYRVTKQVLNFNKFFKEYEGKSCKGKKCPHYGTEMTVVGNKLICPLHSLEGDAKTEIIIKKEIEIIPDTIHSFKSFLHQ